MEKSKLHVSFEEDTPDSNIPDKNTGRIHDKKKSILASANNRMTSNTNDILDTRFGEDDNMDAVSLVDPLPPVNHKEEPRSKLPVPITGGSPPTNQKPPDQDASKEAKTMIPVPQSDGSASQNQKDVSPQNNVNSPPRVPRYNPSTHQPTDVNWVATNSKKEESPLKTTDVVNPMKKDPKESKEKDVSSKSSVPSPKSGEQIPLQDMMTEPPSSTENPFNKRREPVQKDAPPMVKMPSKSSLKDTAKDSSKNTKDALKDNTQSSKDIVKTKLLLHGTQNQNGDSIKEDDKSEKSSAPASSQSKSSKDVKESKQNEAEGGGKDTLNVPPTPNHIQSNDKRDNRFPLLNRTSTPNPPATPRKSNKLNTDKSKANGSVRSRDASPARSPSKSKADKSSKTSPNSRSRKEKEKEKTKEKSKTPEKTLDPVTARDVKVESSLMNTEAKTGDQEAKETADNILNELGEKPRSILARAALKKIATRNAKPGNIPGSAVDAKHVSVNEKKDRKDSKNALSVPASATGKRDGHQEGDREDKLSVGSRRDSTKYSIDSVSRKSVDIRMQNHVALVNKQYEEKPKSPLTNTDSWIRSAIPYLPIGVAVVCLLLNIVIPGTGTMLSGFAILCCGKPRVHSKDDHVIVSICVNVWVGFAQLFTITFLLVGWFWSLAWGIRMVILSVEYRREQKLQREKQLQTMALSAFGSASNVRGLFP